MAKAKIKDVVVSVLPDCDICQVEFSSSKPNKAKYDGMTSSGPWATACTGHAGNLIHKATRYVLESKAKPVKAKLIDIQAYDVLKA